MAEFEQSVAGIGSLADPVRRELYRYVCTRPEPVSRDQAADALRIARHQAKFHLDRLAAEGLLGVRYARLHGRTGPGAGRPAKLYFRSASEISVSLPDRDYELAGRLMADAITEATATGTPVIDALHRLATAHGSAACEAARAAGPAPQTAAEALEIALPALSRSGYEPQADDGRVIMANCPFHALVEAHTELVCQMNHALLGGLTGAVAADHLQARLEPGPHRCCVVIECR